VELPWVRKSSTDVFSSYRTTQAPSTSRPTSPSSASSRPSSYSPTSSSRPSSSSSSSSQASPSAPPANLQCGTRIRHDRFGLGNIIAVSGSGDGMKVTVQFDNAGQKVLLVKYARLTVVG